MHRLITIAAISAALLLGLGACSSSAKPGTTTTTTTAPSTQTTQMGGMDPGDTMAPSQTMP